MEKPVRAAVHEPAHEPARESSCGPAHAAAHNPACGPAREPTSATAHKRLGKRAYLRLAVWLIVIAGLLVAVGCEPRQAGEDGGATGPLGNDGTATVAVEWSMSGDCGTCHTAESSAQDATAPAVVHETQGNTCISCHADEPEMAKVHEKATIDSKMPIRLKSTKVDDALCLSCHDEDELAALTQSSAVLTDKEDTVVNPHDVPVSTSHASVDCASCHQVHKPAADLPKTALAACTGCHHEKVFACGTCHD